VEGGRERKEGRRKEMTWHPPNKIPGSASGLKGVNTDTRPLLEM
jgi:hypothetical protein